MCRWWTRARDGGAHARAAHARIRISAELSIAAWLASAVHIGAVGLAVTVAVQPIRAVRLGRIARDAGAVHANLPRAALGDADFR